MFAGVTAELAAIVGKPPIEVGQDGEEEAGRTSLCGCSRHPRLVLREPGCRELRFVQIRDAGLSEVGVRVDESGGKPCSRYPFN
jgi:hypothetical protein